MKRYWISWVCAADDYRPLTFPPHEAICGWWCSGRDASDNAILCAVVDAASDSDAAQAIFREWPEAAEAVQQSGWRFMEQRVQGWSPGDRFLAAPWMVDRLAG